MAPSIVVEDGGGNPASNAYISVEFADQWHDNMGHDFWTTLTRNQKMQAIIRATMYVDQRFKRRYRGLRQSVDQSLGFPRIGAFDDDSFVLFGVPYQVERATAEYALRAAYYNQLSPDPMRTVPPQNFASPPGSLTLATGTYVSTGNFNDGDILVIGNRSYTMQMTLTPVDGHVLIGGSVAASLANLAGAINFVDDFATGLFTASTNFTDGDTITIGGNVGSRTYVFRSAIAQIDGTVLIGASKAQSLANLAGAINNYGNNGKDFYVTICDQNVTAVPSPATLLVTGIASLDIPDVGVESPLNVTLESVTTAGSWGAPTLEIGGVLGVLYFVIQADPIVTAQATLTTLNLTSSLPSSNGVVTAYTPATSSEGAFSASSLSGYAVSTAPVDLVMGPMRTKTEKIGPLEESTMYDGLSQLAEQNRRTSKSVQSTLVNDVYLPEYPEADLWMEQVLRNPATGTRLIRGS